MLVLTNLTRTWRLWLTLDSHVFPVGCLIWVLLFWFWIGRSIDIRHRPLPRDWRCTALPIAYFFAVLVCAFAAYGSMRELNWWLRFRPVLRLVVLLPQSMDLVRIASGTWYAAGFCYFGYKLVRIWRPQRAPAELSAR
jgi:hypothetical protein